VDYIFAVQVLLHIQNTHDLLQKLHSMLKPGGHLIVVDFDQNPAVVSDLVHNGFIQSELAEQVKTIGFKDVVHRTFYRGKAIFMNQDASLFIMDAKKI
jgi:2-polyprenyl-3-methyl-5-hydroxy-6-metoxy-1,4-benzoquinol methylase